MSRSDRARSVAVSARTATIVPITISQAAGAPPSRPPPESASVAPISTDTPAVNQVATRRDKKNHASAPVQAYRRRYGESGPPDTATAVLTSPAHPITPISSRLD